MVRFDERKQHIINGRGKNEAESDSTGFGITYYHESSSFLHTLVDADASLPRLKDILQRA
jgi:hypothetical protein